MDEKTILQFKGKIVASEMTIQQFAKDHRFNPNVFSQAINGHTNMRGEYEKAINNFIDPETRLYMVGGETKDKVRLGGNLKNLIMTRLFPDGRGTITLHRATNHVVYEWLKDIAEKEALGTGVRQDVMKITDVLDEYETVELILE